MNTASFDLACIGRAGIDLYGEQPGSSLGEMATFARHVGSSTASAAIGAARLGLRVAMIARVGDEPNGRFVRASLAREGVDVSQMTTDPKRPTAAAFVAIGEPGSAYLPYRDDSADMALEASEVDSAFLARCRAVLISGTHLSMDAPRAACERAAQAVRVAGGKVVLDIEYRPALWGLARRDGESDRAMPSHMASRHLRAMLPLCDLVLGTEEEFLVAGASDELDAALRRIRACTRALLVVRRAPGCVAFVDSVQEGLQSGVQFEGFDVDAIDTLGAGDAFTAGFLSGWLRGQPLEICSRLANACKAIVSSRRGGAPAMPTTAELHHFLERGSSTRRLGEDAELEHVHRATTRAPAPSSLFLLDLDTRAQAAAFARAQGTAGSDLAALEAMLADAFLRTAGGLRGTGVILGESHDPEVLQRLAARQAWIARSIEAAGSVALEFEAGDSLGLQLRAWPPAHVAKCRVTLHPDDPGPLRERQTARLLQAARACAATGHELLLEVDPPPASPSDAGTMARTLERIYAAGVKPDWWNLPARAEPEAWRNVGTVIERNDPHCRGVLVRATETDPERMGASFEAARPNPCVRGFVVGAPILAAAVAAWVRGERDRAAIVEDVAERYDAAISTWEERDRKRIPA